MSEGETDFAKTMAKAEAGDTEAQCHLGQMYEDGNGVERSADKALIWFQKSAKQGHGPAGNSIGTCFLKGLGVNQNFDEAFKWYTWSTGQ